MLEFSLFQVTKNTPNHVRIFIPTELRTVNTELYSVRIVKSILVCRSSHRICSVKNVFLKISQNLLEDTCARDLTNDIMTNNRMPLLEDDLEFVIKMFSILTMMK